jgi:hypothetical protein
MRAFLALHGGAPACAIAYLAAFALTLVLAAWLTPRHWWRRPTLRGGAVLAGGTLVFGTLLLALAGRPQAALAAATMPIDPAPAPPAASAATAAPTPAPEAGASYRVAEELNLRASRGVHATRLAVLPASSRVVASGAFDGDWWQVRARVDGRDLVGWTSSLWLRRSDEARVHGHPGA